MSISQKFPPLAIVFLSFALLLLLQWPSSLLIHNISITLGILLNEWIFVAGIPMLIILKYKTPLQAAFPFKKPDAKALWWLIVMTFALVILIDYLTFLSEKILPPSREVKMMLEKIMHVESFGEATWRWFLICLTPALCEEFFFRGFFQNMLGHHWGKKISLILTAVFFALIHGIVVYWHLYLLLGFYLGWLMLVGKNLWFPIIAHLINNSWTFLTHPLGHTLPRGGIWLPHDSLIMLACVIVFAISVGRLEGCPSCRCRTL